MIVAGFGFRASAELASLEGALNAAGRDVTAVATVSDKARHPAFLALAELLQVPIISVAQVDLSRIDTATQSAYAQAARQTGSVAEAAALVAAGDSARLIGPRVVSEDRRATCALAQSGERGEPA